MADELEVSKCGPLCQHPGCWQTNKQADHSQHKDTEYMRFLSELLLRKNELKRLQEPKPSDGELELYHFTVMRMVCIQKSIHCLTSVPVSSVSRFAQSYTHE